MPQYDVTSAPSSHCYSPNLGITNPLSRGGSRIRYLSGNFESEPPLCTKDFIQLLTATKIIQRTLLQYEGNA